jgi:hypothetical protein
MIGMPTQSERSNRSTIDTNSYQGRKSVMTQQTESVAAERGRRSVHRVRLALVGAALLVAAGSLLTAAAASATMTPEKCLASKSKAWGNLRKCEAAQAIRELKGQSSDLAQCQATFEAKLAQIIAKATEAEIACRYRDGDDGTVTDYDTGLQWEKKSGAPGLGGLCLIDDVHCVQDQYDWLGANLFVNASADPVAPTACYFDRCDWRLPTSAELLSILDTSRVGCADTTACIDPVFGSTNLGVYWTATTYANNTTLIWQVHFGIGTDNAIIALPDTDAFVRAVRNAF